jgi:hypothetical protein
VPARTAIVDLRKLVAERFPSTPSSPPARLQTGLAFLDNALAGGLPKSAITEIISPSLSAGSASIISALLQTAYRESFFVALIDGRDSFDPEPLDNSVLRHLLWVRCDKGVEALKAADLLLRDGNFPLVIVDLVLNAASELRKIPQTSWYRLQRLIEPTSTALLVLNRHGMVSSAQLKLVLENNWTLENLENNHALTLASIQIQRSHLQSVVSSQWSVVSKAS